MAHCQGPRAQMERYLFGFTYNCQKDVAKIPKVPMASRYVNPARAKTCR